MKKVCVLLLAHVLVFGTASYGAVSEDMYVRKDVYEAHQQSINSKLDMLLEQMRVQREEMKEFREIGQPGYIEWLKKRIEDPKWLDMALRDSESANAKAQ